MVAKMRDINFRLSKMIDTDDSGNSVILLPIMTAEWNISKMIKIMFMRNLFP